jgi:hypothetical protein
MAEPQPTAFAMRRIKRVAVMQLAMLHSAFCAILGLVTTVIVIAIALTRMQNEQLGPAAMAGFILLFALLPVMYAIFGFVMGLLGAWLYNAAAKWLGGVELEVE